MKRRGATRRMKQTANLIISAFFLVATLTAGMASAAADPERWGDYLDFAYVFSSADPESLQERLAQYGQEAGISLDSYIVDFLDDPDAPRDSIDEIDLRRKSIAYLLQYLATRDPVLIELAAETASALAKESDSYESRYWFHYIHAHREMEKGNAAAFVQQNLDLWVNVIVPLEAPFNTLEALSLAQSPNTGFVSALPYLYENTARMILIRSQEMGLHRNLDPLGSLVRLLHHNRVGTNPEVIPDEASSRGYLDRIVARLDGPESDAGSLTFTLLLFEASKYHDESRGLLASEEFSGKTIKAIGVASGAYKSAFGQAQTAQGQAAVYRRVLRQLGEINAAKQRLGVDPHVETPFSIEEAIAIYDRLHRAQIDDRWKAEGFRRVGRDAYLATMRGLWEEIQEASLNKADYYLARSLAGSGNRDEYVRSASGIYTGYLAFFHRYVGDEESDIVPDSAYFAAYEAAKGYGDAFTNFASRTATAAEMEIVTNHYVEAMSTFPFDAKLWHGLAGSLERIGRSGEYLSKARAIADAVARSRHVDSWIDNRKPSSSEIATQRRALSDDLVLMYLGFAASSEMRELDESLVKLKVERDKVEAKLAWLEGKAEPFDGLQVAPAAADPDATARPINMTREIARTRNLLDKLRRKVEARERALPLYSSALETDGLIGELRAQRDNPVHSLLRRMYHEARS
jgi:hypothetical protein